MKGILRLQVVLFITCMLFLTSCGQQVENEDNEVASNFRTYECDYKSTSLFKTVISTKIGDKDVNITGNLFALFVDPLTMKDSDGNTIAYVGDVYGFISQDDHGIYVNGEFDVNMKGKIDIFGETYFLVDSEGNQLATVSFGYTDTSGKIVDNDGNIVAVYESFPFMKDYTVTIYDNNICSDESILLIIASYVSDKEADKKNN